MRRKKSKGVNLSAVNLLRNDNNIRETTTSIMKPAEEARRHSLINEISLSVHVTE